MGAPEGVSERPAPDGMAAALERPGKETARSGTVPEYGGGSRAALPFNRANRVFPAREIPAQAGMTVLALGNAAVSEGQLAGVHYAGRVQGGFEGLDGLAAAAQFAVEEVV